MASTYSTLLRLELQTAGENNDSWGDKANTVFQLLENAISKRQALTVTTADVTLTTNNGADDQARSLCLAVTGALTGNRNIIVPALSKLYLVTNDTTGAYTVTTKTAAGTGVAVTQGRNALLYCDGTNVLSVQPDRSGLAILADANIFTGTSQTLSGVAPELRIRETDGAADEQYWLWLYSSGSLSLRAYNDALGASNSAITIERTGTTVDGIALVSTALTWNGATLFTTANDGAGSGLDADLLDGQSSAFYQSGTNITSGTVAAARLDANLTPTTIELGHASDTTLTRVSAGKAALEGQTIATVNTTVAADTITSGTYTPTVTNNANVASSSVDTNSFRYIRIGSQVFVSGVLDVAKTAAAPTATSFLLTLPIASTFTNVEHAGGTMISSASSYATEEVGIVVSGLGIDATKILVSFFAAITNNRSYGINFSYTVI